MSYSSCVNSVYFDNFMYYTPFIVLCQHPTPHMKVGILNINVHILNVFFLCIRTSFLQVFLLLPCYFLFVRFLKSKMAKTRAMGSRGWAFDNPPSNISKTRNRFDQSDSAFAGLVKLLYGVLQCIHHIGILEENLVNLSLPKGLEKKVKELNSFIKPAHSNLDITFDQILTN